MSKKRFLTKLYVIMLAASVFAGTLGVTDIKADEQPAVLSETLISSDISTKKPKCTAEFDKETGDVKITIAKAEYAGGFFVYMKKAGESKYTRIRNITKKGTKERNVTVKYLSLGKYYFKVKAYVKSDSGILKSKNSKVVSVEIPDLTKLDTLGVGLTGVGNDRELGGYVNRNGQKVKKGLLLRTAKLEAATEEDIAKLNDRYNLGTIVDLRTQMEIDKSPDPEIEGVKWVNAKILSDEDYVGIGDALSDAMGEISPDDPLAVEKALVKSGLFGDDMFVRFLSSDSGKKGFAMFFNELLELPEGKSLLFHCTQGKDRTGCCAMLILSALDVDTETIIKDFLKTNEFNAGLIADEKAELIAKGAEGEDLQMIMATKDQVSEQFMRNAISYLSENYGSPLGYIKNELGITDEQIEQLKDRFLEP